MSPVRPLAVAVLHRTRLYHPLHDARRDWRFRRISRGQVRQWRASGCPAPAPNLVKYGVLRDQARRNRTPVLVETGTFYGDAIFHLRQDFSEIHSIELAPGLYRRVAGELAHLRHIHLHFGDSADLLPGLIDRLSAPALFWLDGHFCAGPSARAPVDPPIGAELDHLLRRPPGRNVVLIDDARLFSGRDGYPSVPELRTVIRSRRPTATFVVELDIIRVGPI